MLRCLRFTTSGTRYYYHPDTRRYACPSSFFRCSRKRPSLLSLACASGRLSFAVGERYYCCVYFLSAISFHVRTYADASFHITIQARSTNTRFTYIRPIFHFVPLVESGICLLVDVATLSTIYDVRHPPLLPPGYLTQELISRP